MVKHTKSPIPDSPYEEAIQGLLQGLKNIIFFNGEINERHPHALDAVYKKVQDLTLENKSEPQKVIKGLLSILENDFFERMGFQQLSPFILSSVIARKSAFREEVENKLNGKIHDNHVARLEGLLLKQFYCKYSDIIRIHANRTDLTYPILEAIAGIKFPLTYYDAFQSASSNIFSDQFGESVLSHEANLVMHRLNKMIEKYKKIIQTGQGDKIVKLRETLFKMMQAVHPNEKEMLMQAYLKISEEYLKRMKGTFAEITPAHLNENKNKYHDARLLGHELKLLLIQMREAGIEWDGKQQALFSEVSQLETLKKSETKTPIAKSCK